MIYCGDFRTLVKDIPDESIDLFLTDCPYRLVAGGKAKNPKKPMGGIFAPDNKKQEAVNYLIIMTLNFQIGYQKYTEF